MYLYFTWSNLPLEGITLCDEQTTVGVVIGSDDPESEEDITSIYQLASCETPELAKSMAESLNAAYKRVTAEDWAKQFI